MPSRRKIKGEAGDKPLEREPNERGDWDYGGSVSDGARIFWEDVTSETKAATDGRG